MTTTQATLHARDPFRSLLALSRRGGDVARYRAGTEAAFLINNPAYVKHVLVDNHEKGVVVLAASPRHTTGPPTKSTPWSFRWRPGGHCDRTDRRSPVALRHRLWAALL